LRIKRLTAAPMLEMKWLFCSVRVGVMHILDHLNWSAFVAPSLVAENIAAFWAERKCTVDTPHARRSRVIALDAARALATSDSVTLCHLYRRLTVVPMV
jgi:hypothetical protein